MGRALVSAAFDRARQDTFLPKRFGDRKIKNERIKFKSGGQECSPHTFFSPDPRNLRLPRSRNGQSARKKWPVENLELEVLLHYAGRFFVYNLNSCYFVRVLMWAR